MEAERLTSALREFWIDLLFVVDRDLIQAFTQIRWLVLVGYLDRRLRWCRVDKWCLWRRDGWRFNVFGCGLRGVFGIRGTSGRLGRVDVSCRNSSQ